MRNYVEKENIQKTYVSGTRARFRKRSKTFWRISSCGSVRSLDILQVIHQFIKKERKKKKIGRLRGGIDYGLQEDLHKERQNTTAQQGEFLFVHKLERKQTQPMRKKKDFQTLI